MGRFDRYMLSQLLVVFGFFALVLVGVYWINRAVSLVNTFMGDGSSAAMVFELLLLSLPSLIKLVLPIAAFLAVLQTCNRLFSESELVVVQATGFSSFRLARPVLVFGLIAAVLIGVLAHFLVPASVARLAAREASIAEAAASRLLVPGTFQHPTRGVTVYVRDIEESGLIQNLLLQDRRDPNYEVTYSAASAILLKDDDGPKLIMFDGMAQSLNLDTGRLAVTRFEDFAFAIGTLVEEPTSLRLDPRTMPTPLLLAASEELQTLTRRDATWLKREAHLRFAESLLTPALCVLGFSALMLGTFSRFGLWRQIVTAVLLVVVIKLVDNAAADLAKRSTALLPVIYLPSGLAAVLAMVLLGLSGGQWRRLLPKRRSAP